MATFDQPTLVPTWCEDNPSNIAQPPDSLRASGWTANEPVMAEFLNWLLNSYGSWIGYLNQANAATVLAGSLDMSTRLVSGGQWSYNGSTQTLSWSQDAYLSIPSIALAENDIPAGSVILGENVVAYVTANVPVTISGSITSGNQSVANVETTAALSVGMTVSGQGIPSNTTLTAISGDTLTLSQAATATNQAATLTFASSGSLQVQAAPAQNLIPGPNTVIIAVGRNDGCLLGANSGQMRLDVGESKPLLGSGYVSTFVAPAGYALTTNQAVYLSQGSADARTGGSLYPCEANATNGAQRGQFFGFALGAFAQNAQAKVVTSGVINQFSGLSTGKVYYLDPKNPGNITTTKPTASGQYVVPVGQAVSPTSLDIFAAADRSNAAIPNGNQEVTGNLQVDGNTTLKGRLYASSGIKSSIDMGQYWNTTGIANNGEFGLQRTLFNSATSNGGASGVMDRYWPATHAGSVVGIAIWLYSSVAQGGNVNIRINRNTVLYNFVISAPAAGVWTPYTMQFPVGQYPFNPNDTLLLTLLNFSSSANIQVSGELTVEFAT